MPEPPRRSSPDAESEPEITQPKLTRDDGPPQAAGTLEQTPFVYILVFLLGRSLSGSLTLRDPGGGTVLMLLRDGAPVSVEMSAPIALLGEKMAGRGWLSRQGVPDAVARASGHGLRLGEHLVQEGQIPAEIVTELLQEQIEERCAALTSLLPDTTFRFHARKAAPPRRFEPWDPMNVLLSTVRAWGDRKRIHATVRWLTGKPLAIHPTATVSLDGLKLTQKEAPVMRALRAGGATLESLYAEHGDGLSSLLYTLAVTRQFAFGSDKGPPMARERPATARPMHSSAPPSPALAPRVYEAKVRDLPPPRTPLATLPDELVAPPGSLTPPPGSLVAPPAAAPAPPSQRMPTPAPPLHAPPPLRIATPAPRPPAGAPPAVSRKSGPLPMPTADLSETGPYAATPPLGHDRAPVEAAPPPPSPPPPPPGVSRRSAPLPLPPPPVASVFHEEARTAGNTLSLATQPRSSSSPPSARAPLVLDADGPRGPPSIAPAPGEPPSSLAPSGVSQAVSFIEEVEEREDPSDASASVHRPLPPPPPLTMGRPAKIASARAAPIAAPAEHARASTEDPKARAGQELALAEEALERGEIEVADRHALAAARLDPASAACAALQIWTASKMGAELPESVRAFSRILDDHPECEPALYYRGMLLKEAGKDRAALRDFVTLVRLNPDHTKGLIEVKLLRSRIPKGTS